ncbi:hypothetical protein GCM10010082_00490 [Kushneria pakistanensis]|uniref:Uncharacterized protein n=1 Tax=Kushneria pakistanensis TaxID=1508770 RepID=A0ABQ3F903_9GAMM|nr:hypothetical protein GCM10010082_00490 [Kushneria pakistanensis]
MRVLQDKRERAVGLIEDSADTVRPDGGILTRKAPVFETGDVLDKADMINERAFRADTGRPAARRPSEQVYCWFMALRE